MSFAWARTMSRMVTIGKSRPQGLPVEGWVEAGPVVPMQAPSTLVQMTKKRSVSIGLPAADHRGPPALRAGDGVAIGDMLVGRERVADEHGVRLFRIELAIGLVGDLEGCEVHPAVEPQGIVRAEMSDEARRIVDLAEAKGPDDRSGRHGRARTSS